jgi:hypothetical protein
MARDPLTLLLIPRPAARIDPRVILGVGVETFQEFKGWDAVQRIGDIADLFGAEMARGTVAHVQKKRISSPRGVSAASAVKAFDANRPGPPRSCNRLSTWLG